jgi:hypothetical protein
MTYEEYKNNKNESSKKGFISKTLNKMFTIIIFVGLVLIISNISPKFKNFIIDEVLNSTMDFSFVNKITNKITNIFSTDKTVPVINTIDNYEKYEDGIKYNYNGEVLLKDSGIVTFIGNKEKYGNTIIIQQSNGYYAWYGNVTESIKIYDYVESGTSIGKCENEYYYVLLKDDKFVNIIDEN